MVNEESSIKIREELKEKHLIPLLANLDRAKFSAFEERLSQRRRQGIRRS
jgi:hypothetical protein